MDPLLLSFFVFAALFLVVERLRPLFPKQRIIRTGWRLDLLYFATNKCINMLGITAATLLFAKHDKPSLTTGIFGEFISKQYLPLQLIEILIISEAGGYIIHRLCHTFPLLWKFHAIHHSSTELDWLAGTRNHPVDHLLTKLFQISPLFLLGFSSDAILYFAIFSIFYASFVHSNLKTNLGPLKYFFSYPEYHHLHHSRDEKHYNKNMGGTLVIFDWLFGTQSMPNNRVPKSYGIDEPLPESFIAQVLFPFGFKKASSKSIIRNKKVA